MNYPTSAIALCAACAALTGIARPNPSPPPPLVVHIANYAFVPATVSIAPGQTIRFVNDDNEAHTVTAKDKSFDSTGLDMHDSWQHTFVRTGHFSYYCQMHPMMTGEIVVGPAAPQ